MFTWVGSQFDIVLSNYVVGVVSSLMTALVPLALIMMTGWVSLFGWAVARGDVAESIPTFLWKVFKIGLVLAFSLQSAVYINNVSDSANSLATGVAATFLPSGVDPGTITSPYQLLDKFSDESSIHVFDMMKEASLIRLDMVFAAVIFSFGSVIYLCVTLFVVTLSKVLLTFVIAVGPLFILCLAWKPTVRFFDSWLSMLLNTVVLTWFTFFALGLSSFLASQVLTAIQTGGGFLGPNFNPLGEATRYFVMMVLMAIICFQAPTLASALTGGAAVQQGVQMIQNAMVVAGLRKRSNAGDAGGTVRGGTGIHYSAGRAAGVAAAAARRYSAPAAAKASAAVRTAAQRWAAMRSSD